MVKKEAMSKGFIYLLLTLGALLMLLPFVWMISTSLKASNEVMIMPPQWIPGDFQWENYSKAFEVAPFARYAFNSFFVLIASTLGELITTILAAYAFSRVQFYGKNIIFAILLGTMMVPGEVLLTPNFVTLVNLGWIDQYEALIVPWLASIFSIFLLRQFFLGIPQELSYAAKIDGCSDFKFLWTIMVPLAKPALITIVILKAIGSWNAFLWPLIVTNSEEMRTLPVGLTAFSTETGTVYELLMAASTMIILPMIILYIILQKYIIEGVAKAGLKG
ncbi:MAG: carbohydrate ABC transporter permease [Bacillota bacterium]|uniref:Carbohydrate ABC transporter permease n=1 Tax=Virgibacillus salarius TaxID=447199 RepID=A0A941DSY1_9BACI|nr:MULTISPECIES: carbohydrate ABC transporter permease [Bacillaceae]NAZ07637.1 ABC transporter permease subunit [Agaribacter marinus]MBR7794917.1 carbohydrate ABC transporter permease [Virgibacillus salarius]MCC2249412.1 carbohydrate ABC transporter permease [Virgibacillus sp. AGTR]MDY7045030.1 carbohydrate ABC transporter permease [Virgibacillus sp. M23]QRZ18798.1 carbohydrate ABC transporter permease [Virgibacillus sp. AGTR]